MAYQGNNPNWNTSTHKPQSADPANPTNGMSFYSDGTSRAEGLWQYKGGVWEQISSLPTEKFQTKTLGSNVTSIGDIAALTFNNLVIGRAYVVHFNYRFVVQSSSLNEVGAAIRHNGVNEVTSRYNPVGSTSNGQIEGTLSYVFEAVATTVTINAFTANATNFIASGSKSQIIELPLGSVTTDFT